MGRKSVLSQLQSVGEGALGKLSQSPATRGAVQGAIQLKDRGERLVHALESVEARLAAIEARLDELEKPKRTATRARAAASKPRAAATKAEAGS